MLPVIFLYFLHLFILHSSAYLKLTHSFTNHAFTFFPFIFYTFDCVLGRFRFTFEKVRFALKLKIKYANQLHALLFGIEGQKQVFRLAIAP